MTTPSSSSLADVIDTILDKGLVIDAYVRVSIVGIELLTVDARIVVASVDTYLRFAEGSTGSISPSKTPNRPAGTDGDVTNKSPEVCKAEDKGALESPGEKFGEKLGEAQRQAQRDADRGLARNAGSCHSAEVDGALGCSSV